MTIITANDWKLSKLLEKYNNVEEKPQEYWDVLTQLSKNHKMPADGLIGACIGYTCFITGKTWNIKIKDMKTSIDSEANEIKKDLFKTCFNSHQGKKVLLEFINSKE